MTQASITDVWDLIQNRCEIWATGESIRQDLVKLNEKWKSAAQLIFRISFATSNFNFNFMNNLNKSWTKLTLGAVLIALILFFCWDPLLRHSFLFSSWQPYLTSGEGPRQEEPGWGLQVSCGVHVNALRFKYSVSNQNTVGVSFRLYPRFGKGF